MRPVAALRQMSTPPPGSRDPAPRSLSQGGCYGFDPVAIVDPAPSYEVVRTGNRLWILPPHRHCCWSLLLMKGCKMSAAGTEEVEENTTKRRCAPISVHHRRNRCSPSSGTSVHYHRNTHSSRRRHLNSGLQWCADARCQLTLNSCSPILRNRITTGCRRRRAGREALGRASGVRPPRLNRGVRPLEWSAVC